MLVSARQAAAGIAMEVSATGFHSDTLTSPLNAVPFSEHKILGIEGTPSDRNAVFLGVIRIGHGLAKLMLIVIASRCHFTFECSIDINKGAFNVSR